MYHNLYSLLIFILKWVTEVYSKNWNLYAISSVSLSPRESPVWPFFSRSSQISYFRHLSLILKSPLKNTQHHLYSLLIFAIFFYNLSFRHALLSIFGNAHWILKTALQTSSPSLWFFPILLVFSFSIAMHSIFGNVAMWVEIEGRGPGEEGEVYRRWRLRWSLYSCHFCREREY